MFTGLAFASPDFYNQIMKKAFLYSFKHSLPIFISFAPVGIVYGILMQTNGYAWYWSGATSLAVFAGSLQYLMIDFFRDGTSYMTVAVMALLLNSRHIFYGIPFIEKWKDYGAAKWFLIFALPDEAFSLHISSEYDEKLIYIFNAFFVLIYWLIISILGGLLGSLIRFPTEGMDFALTALFIVIVLEQLKTSKSFVPALIAAISSILCLIVIGPDYFILPSLVITVTALMLMRKKLEVADED